MEKLEILEKIIEEGGSCNWIRYGDGARSICDNCPINGENRNCADFSEQLYKGGKKTAQEQNEAYKKLAERTLVEIAFEDMMEGEHD